LSSMHIASANLIDSACGLGFDSIYDDEKQYIPIVVDGFVEISNKIGLGYN